MAVGAGVAWVSHLRRGSRTGSLRAALPALVEGPSTPHVLQVTVTAVLRLSLRMTALELLPGLHCDPVPVIGVPACVEHGRRRAPGENVLACVVHGDEPCTCLFAATSACVRREERLYLALTVFMLWCHSGTGSGGARGRVRRGTRQRRRDEAGA